jgi:hypothetical protein
VIDTISLKYTDFIFEKNNKLPALNTRFFLFPCLSICIVDYVFEEESKTFCSCQRQLKADLIYNGIKLHLPY